MLLKIESVKLVADGLRKDSEGAQVPFVKVLYLGGSLNVANPKKFVGDFKSVEVEVELNADVRAYAQQTTGGRAVASGWIGHQIRALSIVSANK